MKEKNEQKYKWSCLGDVVEDLFIVWIDQSIRGMED